MACDVFVVGALHLDVIVNAPRLPRLDETLIGDAVDYAFGGKGGNQAVSAARMGAKTAMAGRVGSDRFGEQILAVLQTSGVDHTRVHTDDGASGMSVAIVDAEGNYGAVVVSAANQRIAASEVLVPDGTKLVLLQNEISADVNLAVAQAARAAGARVIWNAAPARGADLEFLALTDILVVNRLEAEDMTGEPAPREQTEVLAGMGPEVVIVTRGGEGVARIQGGTFIESAAFAVDVISTHGAGDMFAGAFAAQLSGGADIGPALDFSQAAAALHVSHPVEERGAITSRTVNAFLKSGH